MCFVTSGGFCFRAFTMVTPRPLTHFLARIQKGQCALNATIQEPFVSPLALLILSCPICAVTLDSHEAKVLDFFGAHWIFTGPRSIVGFFESEEDAIHYARSCFVKTIQATSAS